MSGEPVAIRIVEESTTGESDLSPDVIASKAPADDESSTDGQTTPHESKKQCSASAQLPTHPPLQRTKSNQRWMKLRTTVQISGAISQKTKPSIKREDSFLKRFSTRQIPELQETMDTGDDGEGESSNDGTKSGREKKQRRRRRKPKQSLTVVNPDSDFYYYWLLLVTCSVLYNLWSLIVRQSFPELQNASPPTWFAIDTVTDVTFYLDVFVQLRTGYLEQGLMVYNSQKLAYHYLGSKHFILDLVAITPIEYIYPLFVWNYVEIPILRFPRFLKVYRLYEFYYFAEARTVYPNVYRVVNLIHILLLLAHWFGCFYFLISEAGGFKGYWAYPQRPGEYETLTRKYLGSLYWSTLTLTTIGDLPTPETNAEYIFTIVSYLIGVFIFATIVGQVGNVITNRNANRLEFERLLDGAKTYMRHHKVPGGMKKRVLRWYDYSWSRGRIQGGGDINTALGLLPDKLKTELALHVNLSVLKKVTIFQECQPEFLHDLVLKMKAYIFTPGDLICRKGEVAREMFIIADGILEVISETGRVMTTMQSGDFFGEIGILNLDGLNKRTADVRSVGYSELFSLSREDVLTAMKDYPEAQDILQKLGKRRLMEARNMNKQFKNAQKKKEAHRTPPAIKCDKNTVENKNIVEKIRTDVKNVLKIGRKYSRAKSDSLELVPLTKSSSDVKSGVVSRGTLSRMSKVYNENNSNEEDPLKSPVKLGAGLPLLQRLKILKEKQDQDKKENEKAAVVTSPVQGATLNPMDQTLPLLQRIKLIKQKEDAEKSDSLCSMSVNSVSQQTTVRTQHKSPFHHSLKLTNNYQTKKPFIDKKIKALKDTTQVVCLDSPASFADTSDSEKWKLLQKATVISDHKDKTEDCSGAPQTFLSSVGVKKGTVSFKSDTSLKTFEVESEICDASIDSTTYDKNYINKHLFEGKKKTPSSSKTYRAIDDLSPEYADLPFVKKLKILNERQKLAELEKDLAVRSSSLDSGGDIGEAMASFNPSELTRSVSEAVAIEVVIRNQQNRDNVSESKSDFDSDKCLVSPPGSPESNETIERRKLKSILKNLSSGSFTSPYSSSINLSPAHPQFKQLIRAQTVEGYVARHSKLTKCVTFSQVDVPSPPVSPCFQRNDEGNPKGLIKEGLESDILKSPLKLGEDTQHARLSIDHSSAGLIPEGLIQSTSAPDSEFMPYVNQCDSFTAPSGHVQSTSQSIILTSALEKDIGELAGNIENVIQDQIEGIIYKYESQFASLTSELLKRDSVIADLRLELLTLRRNIMSIDADDFSDRELEMKTNHVFMRDESVITVLGKEDAAFEETVECPPLRSGSDTYLDMATDSEYSTDEDDEPPYDNQWEFKLLAEEMDKRDNMISRRASYNSHWQTPGSSLRHRPYGLSFSFKELDHRKHYRRPFLRSSSLPQSGSSRISRFNHFTGNIKKKLPSLGSSNSPPSPRVSNSNLCQSNNFLL